MPITSPIRPSLSLLLAALAVAAQAQQTPVPDHTAPADAPKAAVKQPMHPDEPMQTGMKKDDMKEGDVRKAAAEKNAAMANVLKKEETMMPPADPTRPPTQ